MKHKRIDEIEEIKNIKNQKFGTLFKKTLEDQFKTLEKLKGKNNDRFGKELSSFRDTISDLIKLQEENSSISSDNLELLEENIETEKKNITICEKNKEYLTDLYKRINDL